MHHRGSSTQHKIMDSDLVLVMDDGRAAEFDTPSSLLSADGMFKSLVDAWEEEGK